VNQTQRVIASLIVVVVACTLIAFVQSQASVNAAQASLLSAQNLNSAILLAQQTPDRTVVAIVIVAVILLTTLWFGSLKKLLLPMV
jgi:hypothetical protein